ncbi:MAG: arginine decarboxylase [Gammaproteobacteria bacterium RIFOXYD12_FULL_61_37]|nr:MAG: arginine decarboxylase [Gammaproteobacteria bacterium RIFOXYD12_FULL_61_37]
MTDSLENFHQTYGIGRWGSGFFEIGENGHLFARPNPLGKVRIDLYQLANEIRETGLSWPVLVRFTDILHHRVASLCAAFRDAAAESGYSGRHSSIYPIKVNQQRIVVEEILAKGGDCVGLEAGSKPELMVVLALSRPGSVIVCNGYKDREYIRLALIGLALGHRVYIVIEKPSEFDLVLEESVDLGIRPLLGVRVRLAASALGNWQNSGGDKSKFGLASMQVLELIEKLRQEDLLDCLCLIHTHIGSQVPNLRDIRRGMGEVARFYGELRRLGANIEIVDVGGGLGVDYEGTATRHYCSMNYSMEAYAREVVKALNRICLEQGLPPPHIFTESGRAVTAHHAVLIANVSDREYAPEVTQPPPVPEDAPEVLHTLAYNLDHGHEVSVLELYQEARHGLEESHELFQQGGMTLEQRALAEQLFYATCHQVYPLLQPGSHRHREILDELHEILADKLFMNLSLFQSMPDIWAIDQIFPVAPLHRLDEEPTRSAIMHDLTCDSDGRIQHYVEQDGVESTLPVHAPVPGEPYLFGFFLVGAYQEILGDMHNLFGDTDAVNVELTADGYCLTQPEQGDTVDELLRYVHFDIESMLDSYRKKLHTAGIPARAADQYYDELKAGLHGYTYLED